MEPDIESSAKTIVRFAAFEVDLQSGVIFKYGLRIKLQDQPFRILVALLEKPGQVVSRDELRERIWGGDTFVDFEHGLSAAVNRLRDALSDTAENPRYVETVARRGYRFIGSLEVPAQPQQPPFTSASPDRSRLGWAIALVSTAVLAAAGFLSFREKPAAAPGLLRLQIATPQNSIGVPVLSPDGRKVAYHAGGRLWVQFLESGEFRDLTSADSGVPFWSPDSRFVGFPYQAKLKKIDVSGGLVQTVAELRSNQIWGCGAWSKKDVIVFGDRPVGLFRVSAAGGVPVQLTSLDRLRNENAQYCPSFLPDGSHFVYMRGSTDEGKSGIYLGSIDTKPTEQKPKLLVLANSQAIYSPSPHFEGGHLLFVRGSDLMAQPLDHNRIELTGKAAVISEKLSEPRSGAIFVSYSASDTGLLAFKRMGSAGSQLTWYDREGKALSQVGETGRYGYLALSPDDSQVAVGKLAGGADSSNIWQLDLNRGGLSSRASFGALLDTHPVWSCDGNHIVFSSNRDGAIRNLYQKRANGAKEEEVLLNTSENKFPTSWSRDGRFLFYSAQNPKTKSDLWILPMDGKKKPVPFLTTEFNESHARISPDGRWVAYASDESGQLEVYLRSFTMDPSGTRVVEGSKWQVSSGYGSDPKWRADGKELFYRLRGGELMAVGVRFQPGLQVGKPERLGPVPPLSWDPSADGKRFIGLANKDGSQPYTLIMNWQAALPKT